MPFWTPPACYNSGLYSITGPKTVSAPDCLRSLGSSERKPFKSAFLENAKPAKLGQTSHWVSLCGDSEISRRAGKSRNTNSVERARGQKGWNLCFHWVGDIFHFKAWCKILLVFGYLQTENINTAIKIFHLSQMRPCTNFLLCAGLSATSIHSLGRHPKSTLAFFEVKRHYLCGRQGGGQGGGVLKEGQGWAQGEGKINTLRNQSQWFLSIPNSIDS